MERIRTLINKLQQQAEHGAGASVMMITVQLLQAELEQVSAVSPRQFGSSKVAVVLPSSHKISYLESQLVAEPVRQAALSLAEKTDAAIKPVKWVREDDEHSPFVETAEPARKQEAPAWSMDSVQEVPTLAHQKEFKEMNDIFGQNGSSLNETLKTEKKELVSVLTQGPVKDLKKAIGINDRFVFLSELFRGDEPMYERSIKTINNFRIYPEAEYWIERELKVKLGWDENKDVVKQFCQLVKRRFI